MADRKSLHKSSTKDFERTDKKRRGAGPADCCHQQPHPLPQPLPQPRKLLPLPQQSRSRMIQQQLSPPKPHPLPQPLPFPQQASRRMIQIQLLHPQPLLQPLLSHPHPQFVAAKSLILFPPRDHLQCIICRIDRKVQKKENLKLSKQFEDVVQIQSAIAPLPVGIDVGVALSAPAQKQCFYLLCGECEGWTHLQSPLGEKCGCTGGQRRSGTGAGERFITATSDRSGDSDTGSGKIRLDDLISRIPTAGVQEQTAAVGIIGGDREKRRGTGWER